MTGAGVAVTPTSTLVGGLLAGSGLLHTALTVDEVVAELELLRDSPSYWVPALFADDAARERRTREIGRRLARWSAPDLALVEQTSGVLDEGWRRAALQPGSSWAPPALRFEADSLDALRQLRAIGGLDNWRIVGHLRLDAGRVAWTWPLRVTAPDAAGLDALRSTLQYDRYYRVEEAAEGDVVDIAVVDPSSVGFLEHVLATVAVVIGADAAFDPAGLLDNATRIGLAGVLLVPDAPASGLIDALLREVSHDEPLDVAAALVVPQATLVASPELLGISSIRTWTAFVAERIGADAGIGQRLEQILRGAPFDHESGGGEATLDAISQIPEADLREMTEIRLQMSSAPPPNGEPTARELPEIDVGEDVVAPPDERRLQAKISDETKRVRTDAFVAGARHQVRVRIAKMDEQVVAATEIFANALFRSPVPGKEVELSVVVRLRGHSGKPKRRTLQLPASADSKWTSPVPIDVPANAKQVAIEILVLHEGRTVQSAVLSGPVVDAAAAPGATGLTLAVDADTPPSDLNARSTTASTILVSGGLKGEPYVLDLSASGRLLPAERLDKAAKAIRQILFDTFQSPPTDLAGAAAPLTKLAVWGATLRNQLKTGAGGFHDDDPWIHVVSFGDALVPFELIYTHKMPDSDEEVPVCDTALAGAGECAANCPDRERSDRVCPFGFWATSKVVERRVHVDNRTRAMAPLQRKVAVISGAVAGMSSKADADDPNASQRIVDALTAAVPKDRFRRVTTWKDLADAVDVGRPGVIVLVTHTVKPPNEDEMLAVKFELGGDVHPAHRVDDTFVNPGLREPGPVVLALGCDTGDLDIGFADWIATLHAAGAEVVVSTLSPVPGKEVAMFVERMFTLLPKQFAGEPPHRFGAVLTAVRRATVATGDVLGLAVTASGDGDVELVGAL